MSFTFFVRVVLQSFQFGAFLHLAWCWKKVDGTPALEKIGGRWPPALYADRGWLPTVLVPLTAQNRHSLPNVIGAAIGGVENLSDILCDFQPNGVLDKYAKGGAEQLLVVSSLGWMRLALQRGAVISDPLNNET